ncbi:MAG: cysteine synthase A [Bacilli bacterium]|nr:cysteine synthase A [Bacilli bacterium]
MKIYKNSHELIGKTPILELNKMKGEYNLCSCIYAKLEYFNTTGSVKDRIALAMIEDAIKNNKLQKGGLIVEPTSGNTGIGIASVATSMGFRAKIVMPETMSVERRQLIKAYGAEVILSDGKLGMKGAIAKAKEIAEAEGGLILGQFDNPANVEAHYRTTGPEIYEDLDGKVDVFVAGVGTGGTITGVGKYLKEKNKNVKIVAVEPASSPVLSQGIAGPHKIQGIGAGFVPAIFDRNVIDEIITVSNEDAFATSKNFGKTEGVLVGISAGAALFAAISLAKKEEYKGKNIVVLLPDSGDRYLSTDLFKD